MIKTGTLVYLYFPEDGAKFFITLKEDAHFSSHHGIIHHNKIIELNFGDKTQTHKEKDLMILKPSLHDIIMNIKRHTQIIYPKDAGYILMKLGIRNGDRVIESGTGSGALTVAMAYAAAPEGRVYTYEIREEFSQKAALNLEMAGIRNNVDMKVRDVEEEGFDEKDADAVFLDLKTPQKAIGYAYEALRPGGGLALLLPTTNQINDVIIEIEKYPFVEPEITELLIRKYKINPYRLRPEDRMVGHTGYLVFARKGF
ncbi:MAG: hypothetical protein A2Y41_08955 [Spirochaetes bacterium GWB1_36_13]|nr:MAG: hypothetical protein A2Y41_08955 [Spirochaetes bacterium GWB1_36_13]